MTELVQRILTGTTLVFLFTYTFLCLPAHYFSGIVLALLGLIVTTEWPQFFSVYRAPFWCIMPFYPILPCMLLISLNENPEYRLLIPYMILLVCAADSGAYIVGKWYGKHPIAPTISPKKSWEGFAGGYVLSTALLLAIAQHVPLLALLGASVLLNVTALIGDLFESYLKRRAGIKDSGSLLPGHGGLLDRFDSILSTTVVVYACRDILVRYFFK